MAISLPSYAKVKANHGNTASPDAHTTEVKASPSQGRDGAEGRGGVGGGWEKVKFPLLLK